MDISLLILLGTTPFNIIFLNSYKNSRAENLFASLRFKIPDFYTATEHSGTLHRRS